MKHWMVIIGPALAVAVGAVLIIACGYSPAIGWTAGITTLCAAWWISEAIPIPATAIIPLAVLPMVGVLKPEQVAAAYGHNVVLLMLGGFLLSAGMERSGAHRRIALGMVNLFGGSSGRRLVFGFMAASALLSMWISNAATTLMLLPITMAVVCQTNNRQLQRALLLGIAYAASVGGVGTPVGTPPNLIFMGIYAEKTGIELSFLDWMSWAMPVVVIMLPIVAFWLTRGLSEIEPIQLPEVGSWRREEILTLTIFVITALAWIFRQEPWGGWRQLVGMPTANDASVALVGALTMFLIPNGKGQPLLDWETATRIPWGILILFGGGLCIAAAFESSGLSHELGTLIASLNQLPVILLIGTMCLSVTFLTEVTSNSATTTLLMPVLLTAAIAAEMPPEMFMVPATISASFAFMLPVATPPNAIVFGSHKFSVGDMAREGLVLNLVGVVVVTLICYWRFH